MATSVDFENLSASVAENAALPEGAVAQPTVEGQIVAQADPVPVDAGSGEPVQAAQPTAAAPAQAMPTEFVADASNIVHLPASISIDNIKVDGNNLVLEQADGTLIVIKDAAANVPTFLLGDVEVPRVALIAALEAGGINVAFGADGSFSAGGGAAQGSGGNFEIQAGGIGDGFDVSDLLPPTALMFPQYAGRELDAGINAEPEFLSFSIRLSEEGLSGGNRDDGPNPFDTTNERVFTGNFGASDSNGDPLTYSLGLPNPATNAGITSHGAAITWNLVGPNLLEGRVGDVVVVRFTITDPETGDYQVEILGPIDHPSSGIEDVVGIVIPVTVKDPFGGSATANVTLQVEDDSPEISGVRLGATAILDETSAGTPGGFPINVTSAGSILSFSSTFGADGAAAGGGVVYALTLSGNAATNLKTAIGDFPITLVQTNSTTITGTFENGGTQTAFTVKINADGSLTVTQNVPLEHNSDGLSPEVHHNDSLSLAGLVNASVTITDFDNDSVSGGAQIGGAIIFEDDGPKVSENALVRLDDDALKGGIPGGTGDNVDGRNVSGTLAHSFGADGGSIAWLTNGAPEGFTYKLNNGALEVYQGETKVLTITMNGATGAYLVTQDAPIMHAAGRAENNKVFTLTYQVKDNDGDIANGTLRVNVDDDTPTIETSGSEPLLTVDETNLSDNASASFASNFVKSYGADGPGSIAYTLSVVAGNSGLIDTKSGQQVLLSVNNGVVEGRTAAGNHLVFTVKVDADGKVTLDQIRPVKHADPSNHDDASSLTDHLVKLTATITDKDGDSKSAELNIGSNLVFKDDGPSVKPGNAAVTVDEDDIHSLWSHGTSPDGDTEWLTGAAKASGSLASLVNFGADGAAVGGGFGFAATAIDQMEALGLQSKGSPLSYAMVGNTLVAFVDNAHGLDRPVFWMTVESDGDFTFRLFDQLDHPAPPSGTAVQNTLEINFGSIIQATDRDGDSVPLTGQVNVTVIDDIPQINLKATGAVVTHDETAGLQKGSQGDDTDAVGVVARFATLAAPAALGYAHQEDVVEYSVKQGADDSAKISLTLAINGGDGTNSGLMTTDGKEIFLFLENGLIVGRVDNATGQIAFAVAIDQNGGVSIAQYLSLEHPQAGDGSNSSHNEPVSLGSLVNVVLKATDNDGDTVQKSIDIGGKISFQDDGPIIVSTTVGAAIVHDETPGQDTGSNDTAASTLFQLVNNPGSDQHVNNGVGPIGYAQSQGAIVTAVVDYGTDGKATSQDLTYAFTMGSSSTNLLTTEGRAILLFSEGGLIVGRYDANGNGTVSSDEPAAFAIHIHPVTGVVTLVQYVSLQHPTGGPSHDESVELKPNNIQVVLTAKDGDGDTVSKTVNVGNLIKFEDDGPTLTVTAPESIANGLFIEGFTDNGGEWGAGSGVNNSGMAGAWAIGASPVHGAGTIVLEKVGDGYRGADSPTNSVMVDLEASPGNIKITQTIEGLTAGESYGLSFEIGAASGAAAGSAKLLVFWNGVEVGTYEPTSGPMQTIVINVPAIGGGNDKLEFREIGDDGDNSGTFLANVKLNDIIVIDETKGIDSDSDEVAGTVAIENLFNGVNAGTDPDMLVAQFAQGSGAIVDSTISFGADGPATNNSKVYSLELANQNGVDSGLMTTEGKAIFLFKDGNGRIIGVYDADGNGVSNTDKVAFALHVDAGTGVVTLAQYVSLDHPDTNSHDEGVTLAANTVSVKVTATDGDGDKATGSADISGRVLFEDDGPKVISVVPSTPALGNELIVNGSFEEGHANVLGNQDWEIFHSLDGWTSDGGVPFEVQTGGAGGVSTQFGNALVELDSDTVGNPANGNVGDINATTSTNATIQQTIAGTEAGQTYQLSFWYSPRGGDGAGSSGMQIWFDGKLVHEIPANSNIAPGLQQITINVTASGPNAVLAFKGTGSENQHGALLDNVSLKAVYNGNLDDENVPNGATGIPGGPGDDGSGHIATGMINFDAGSDGLKSIVATLGNVGLQGIHVVDGVGTAYPITTTWVPGKDADGNAAGGFEKGGTLVGTMNGGVPAFTLEIRSDGSYTLKMQAPLSHSGHGETGSFEDNLLLSFGFTITDGDGDKATGTIKVNVDDDSPEVAASVPAATVMDEPGSSAVSVKVETYGFGYAEINQAPNIPNLTTNAGTIVVIHDNDYTLQSAGAGKSMIFTAAAGKTFTIESAKIGLDGANTGLSQVTVIGYDANGNALAPVTLTVQSNAIPGVTPMSMFDATGTVLDGVILSKLEIVPPNPAGFQGRIILDNLELGQVTVTPSQQTTSNIDLMKLVNFGEDGAHAGDAFQLKSFTAKDFGDINSGGQPVQIKSEKGILTGFIGADTKVFDLKIDVNGKAVLTLYKPLDHGNASKLDLDFSQFITARDGDGDTIGLGNGSVVFSVKESNHVPTAGEVAAKVDDDGLAGANGAFALRDIDANDGETTPVDPSEAVFLGKLQGGGGDGALVFSFAGMGGKSGMVGLEEVTYSLSGNVLTAKIQASPDSSRVNKMLFQVEITNAATGAYKVILVNNVLHANADNTEASVSVVPPLSYTVSDTDGNNTTADTATGTLKIEFNDDVPTAVDEAAESIAEDAVGTIGGNVLANDTPGADGAKLTSVTIGGFEHVVNTSGTTINTSNGTYTFQSNGAWTFDPKPNLTNATGVNAGFTYTITDGDGDTATAAQPITVTDGAGPVAGAPITLALDDQNLANGSTPGGDDFATGSITFTPGSDAIASIAFGTDLSALGGGLTWERVSATEIVGKDGAVAVVKLELTVVGNAATVKATLEDNYDSHAASGDDLQELGSVKVVATDTDGTTAQGTVNVTVSDDMPVARPVEHRVVLDDEGQSGGISGGSAAGDVAGEVKSATGMLDFAAGADGLRKITAGLATVSGENGAIGTLKAIYVDPITKAATVLDVQTAWSQSGIGGVLTGTMTAPGGAQLEVFKLTINDAGGYELEVFRPLAHPLTSAPGASQLEYEDNLSLKFNYEVTDGDGDTAPSTLTVMVDDDTPDLGTPQSIEVGNGAATTIGSFDILPGADGIKDIDFTSLPANLKSGGLAIQYTEVGNQLIAHTGNQANPVFSLTVNPAGGYVYQSFRPLDGATTTVDATKASGAYGSGPGTAYLLTTQGGENLAVVSGWKADGALDQVKGAATGWGVGIDGNLGAGEMLRFDFQDADNFGVAGFTPPPFSGPAVSEATLSFKNLGGDKLTFVVRFTDNSQTTETVTISGSTKSFTAPAGKFIDYIEVIGVAVQGGGAKVSLASVSRTETTVDLDLQFGVKIVDGDGDAQNATINVGVKNSAPTLSGLDAEHGELVVDEDHLSDGSSPNAQALTQAGSFSFAAADGIGSIKIGSTTLNLAGGFPQTISDDATGKLVVTGYSYNPATGAGSVTYKYTLEDNTLTHGSANGENSVQVSFAVEVKDSDGTTATGSLDVKIVDDVPTANAGTALTVVETAGETAGQNLLANDIRGADGATVTHVSFDDGDTWQEVAAGGSTFMPAGGQGTYVIAGNGDWKFDPNPNSSSLTQNVSFLYRITDGDGDTSQATQAIAITNANAQPTAGTVTATVDDEGLANGNAGNGSSSGDVSGQATTATGTLTHSFNGDAPATTDPINFLPMQGTTGMVGTEQVSYSWDANTDTLMATSARGVVFTVQVDTGNGNYVFTLLKPVLHAAGSGENDAVIDLTYRVTDAQAESATGKLTITIDDDTPIANNDSDSLNIVVDDLDVGSVVARWQILTGGEDIEYTDRDNDGAADLVEWGDGGQSGYGFVDAAPANLANLQTNQTFYLGTFTHYNQSIDSGTSISSAKLTVNFTAIINGEPVLVGPIEINFAHNETPNNGTAEQNRDVITITTQTATVNIDGQNYTLDVRGFVDEQNNIVSTVRTYEGRSNNYQLAVRFVSSDSTSITKTGNVIDNDSKGADGPLLVTAITRVGNTDNTADGAGNFQMAGQYGTLVINKDGTYTYTDGSTLPVGASETFTYQVTDADGDSTTAKLSIALKTVDGDANPLHSDRVLTNISGGSGTSIVISEAALLANDDAGSTISSVTNPAIGGSATRGGGNVTFTDDATAGGSFTYNGQNGAAPDSAVVTIDRTQAGKNTLDGTSLGEILIGRNDASDTIDGKGGVDTIYAGTGNDTIVADQADRLIDGGGGTDTLSVGANFTSSSDAQIVGIENVTLASAATLNLANQSEGFKIVGSTGADTITGGSGADVINGGSGNDILTGNGGADQFRFATNTGSDIVTDYTDGSDKIGFFGGSGSGGVDFKTTGSGSSAGTALSSSAFTTASSISNIALNADNMVVRITSAQTTDQIRNSQVWWFDSPKNAYVLVFNSNTGKGEIWFDSDWSSTGSRTLVATLNNVTTLTQLQAIDHNDIVVYSSAVDPIMLDLDNNGMSFSNIDGGIRFDINADGHADQVAWNTSGDGILAYDVNGDGKIDSGAEIFTPNFAGGHFASGAEALASLDSNGDGIIDANDEAFGKLMIWQDANNDGVGEVGELTQLSDHGITGLSTSTTPSTDVIDGQSVAGEGTVHYADGSSGTYVEMMLDAVLGAPEAAQPTGETFVIEGLNVADIITDYDGGKGDQLDLSALLNGLAPDTDLAAKGYVSIVQNGANAEVNVDVDGGGDSFQTVAVLENFTAVNEAVKVLFEDNSGTKHSDNI